jgi:hypothetical protein
MSNRVVEQRISEMEKELRGKAEQLAAEINSARDGLSDIWNSPPNIWPEWNLKSPFIWLDKQVLPKLPLPTVGKEGEITKDIAGILGISSEQLGRLNQKLQEIVSENRTLAQNCAAITNDDAAAAGPVDEMKISVTIQVPPETTAELKNRYQSVIGEELGEDRKNLLCGSIDTRSWLDREFRTNAEVISVVRHPNGTYNIGFKERGSSFGGVTRLEDYLPDFVLPLFDAIRNRRE